MKEWIQITQLLPGLACGTERNCTMWEVQRKMTQTLKFFTFPGRWISTRNVYLPADRRAAAWNWCIKASEKTHEFAATSFCRLGRSQESVSNASREPLGEWGTPSTNRGMTETSHACPSLLPSFLHCRKQWQRALTEHWKHTSTLSQAGMCQPMEAQKQLGEGREHLRKRMFVTRDTLCSWGAAGPDCGDSYEKREPASVWEILMMTAPYTQLPYTPRPGAVHSEKKNKT